VPLKLHSACIARLEEILAEAIGSLQVTHGIFLDWAGVPALEPLDAALPQPDRQPIPLAAMIDERPLSDFAADRIGRRLVEGGTYVEQAVPLPEPLVGLAPFWNPAAVAHQVVAEFASLPWDYVFSLRLPRPIGSALEPLFGEGERLDVGGGISLLRSAEGLDAEYPLPRPASLLAALASGTAWETGGVYLQVPLAGYADRYGTTGTAMRAVEALQTFLGLGMALRLFRYRQSYTPMAFGPPRSTYHVHRRVDGRWVHDATIDLETTVAMGLEGFGCVELASEFPFGMFVGVTLRTMGACFAQPTAAGRILRAAQWLAGAYASRNETLAFVQAMVAMEILLGDKKTTDMVGIGELLSNRCAYLIGQSQADRESVLADFRGLYAVRSQIVHSGKSRLTYTERIQFFRLLDMCGRSIQKEIELLQKNGAT
jgi:hypothetical protein